MATREPSVELFYDPADLDPDAPRLRVLRNGEGWELRDGDGMLLSKHASQPDAIGAALQRSKVRFSEILVRGFAGSAEWVLDQDMWKLLRRYDSRTAYRHFDVKNLRLHTGLRLIRTARWLIPGRKPPVELYYDPAALDPDAPRLRVSANETGWDLWDDEGALLSSHARLPDEIDAALERSKARFSEILVLASSGRFEWSVSQNPDILELAILLNDPAPARQKAAA